MQKSFLTFQLFRLSLRRREQIDILETIDGQLSREDWLKRLFSKEVTFRHRLTDYTYRPTDPATTSPYVVGRVGRKNFEIENRPPEQDFLEYEHESWKAAVIVLDPREHKDGQKFAFQQHDDVGNPHTLAPRLLQALEASFDFIHYLTSVHPISNDEAFWEFAKRNEGKITRLTFKLEVPNMFGSDDEYEKEMREYREKEKAQKVKIEIRNPDGINTDTERVKYTVDKAMTKGTGKVTARARGENNTFSSQTRPERTKLPQSGEPERPLIERAPYLAERILGREQD